MEENEPRKKHDKKNLKSEKQRVTKRREIKSDFDEKNQKRVPVREKERGGGSWKRYLDDYEQYLAEEEDGIESAQ